VERLETLRGAYLLLDEAMILFDDVIKVFNSSQSAILWQDFFILRRTESIRISSILIHVDRERKSPVIGSHHLTKEAFCCRKIAFR
jgi:hypothetical protein